MSLCGTSKDENGVPPWIRGDFSGFWEGETNPPRRSATAVAARHPSDGGDFQESEINEVADTPHTSHPHTSHLSCILNSATNEGATSFC